MNPTSAPDFPIIPADKLHAAGFLWTESDVGHALHLDPETMSALVSKHDCELLHYGCLPTAGFRTSTVTGLQVPEHAFNAGQLLILHMVAPGPKAEGARRAFARALAEMGGDGLMAHLHAVHDHGPELSY